MADTEKLKLAIERSTKAISLRPSLGMATGVSKTTIKEGLTCEIQEGNWRLVADMPASIGGGGLGPTPGVYGRAALGSCLAIGYVMAAATMNVPITAIEVEVQADYDDGALLGTSDVPPGYLEVRYLVTIESDARQEDILKMVDDADLHSPYLDVFARAQKCKREVNIISPKFQS